MILSASRRTDIPNYYSDWFLNRLGEGFLYVRNPMNPRQVSEIVLSPETVDCIVFWTKNPEPMMNRLGELKNYPFCFQFTLTGYGADVERNVPDKLTVMAPIFRRLSERIGRERVVWRYDPILFTEKYSPEYHLELFGKLARALKGCTERCVISFVDTYVKNRKAMAALRIYEPGGQQLSAFAERLGRTAAENGMEMFSCCERMDLEHCGIKHGSCIDQTLIERVIGCGTQLRRDRNQRPGGGCMESIDIGRYDTCRNGCVYCYASHDPAGSTSGGRSYNPLSPILCGELTESDRVTPRQMQSVRKEQLSLF